jgi:hypothetical protein
MNRWGKKGIMGERVWVRVQEDHLRIASYRKGGEWVTITG